MRREGGMKYGGSTYYSARYQNLKILQNTPWEEMQFFNLEADPYEKSPLTKNGVPEYQKLFRQLTEHISFSGAVPWKSQAQVKNLTITPTN
jgi:hypothetical protein